MKRIRPAFMLLLLSFMILLAACATNPVTGKRQLMLMSEAQEIQLGRDYDPQILAAFGEYKHDDMLSLLQERTKEMGLISHRPGLEYHIRILDSPVINAFAVPGGYIYLTRGILAQFNNEAEMIGVLGHEMGHITARHSVARQSKQQLGQLLFIGGMIASEEFRKYGEYAMAGMQLLFLSYSREDEREADRLGVEYTSKTGFDAKKMADFYQVLVKMNLSSHQGGVPTFLSTHPDPGNRYEAVKQDAAKWQEELSESTWKVNADGYLRLLDGMVYGEDPRQGYVDANVFYHPDLRFSFSFPRDWKLENSPMQVSMAPEDGKALMIFTLAQGSTLEEAAQNTISQLQLDLIESNKTSVNGMTAISTLSSQTSQDQSGQPQTIKVKSSFIEDGDHYYVFHGVSTEADFGDYERSFISTMNNFKKLTDPARLNVQPARLSVREVRNSTTLANALRSFHVPADQMEDFAFLNNMALTDQVEAGTLIKIVVD
jgi:predicted Zn-dependent protease